MLLSLLFSQPLLFIAIVLAIVIALTFHEYAHAAVAYALGDRTAERMGRMTLNPLVHLDPVGFLMVLVVGFGYAKPVPYNPANLERQRLDPVLIGIAGPGANILMAFAFGFVLKVYDPMLASTSMLTPFLFYTTTINLMLAVFNLIPIPPLDGSKVLLAIFHDYKWAKVREAVLRHGPFILLLLILVDAVGGVGIFSWLFNFVGSSFFRLLGIPI